MEQDQVDTIDMPYESPEEISFDDEFPIDDEVSIDDEFPIDDDVSIDDEFPIDDDVSIDDEFPIDDEYEDIDESDYSDYDSDSEEIDLEMYNSTEGSDLGRKYSVRKRYNLDIIDNKKCLDRYYRSISSGRGVDIYIIDTGLNYRHKDLR